MTQGISDRFWQAEARNEATKQFIRDIKQATRRKFTTEEKTRIVLEGFRSTHLSGTSAAGKVSVPVPAMPG